MKQLFPIIVPDLIIVLEPMTVESPHEAVLLNNDTWAYVDIISDLRLWTNTGTRMNIWAVFKSTRRFRAEINQVSGSFVTIWQALLLLFNGTSSLQTIAAAIIQVGSKSGEGGFLR